MRTKCQTCRPMEIRMGTVSEVCFTNRADQRGNQEVHGHTMFSHETHLMQIKKCIQYQTPRVYTSESASHKSNWFDLPTQYVQVISCSLKTMTLTMTSPPAGFHHHKHWGLAARSWVPEASLASSHKKKQKTERYPGSVAFLSLPFFY